MNDLVKTLGILVMVGGLACAILSVIQSNWIALIWQINTIIWAGIAISRKPS